MAEIKPGSIVTLDKNGRLSVYTQYNRLERAVRGAGALFGIKWLSVYHERQPVGVYFSGAVAVYGVVQLDGDVFSADTKVTQTLQYPVALHAPICDTKDVSVE